MKGLTALLLVLSFLAAKNTSASEEYPYPEEIKVQLKRGEKGSYIKGTLKISNPGNLAWLVQAWTEDEDKTRYANVFPSLTRFEPNSSRVLSIYPDRTPQAKELKWLLVSFIPPKDQAARNRLTIPVSYRLKITKES